MLKPTNKINNYINPETFLHSHTIAAKIQRFFFPHPQLLQILRQTAQSYLIAIFRIVRTKTLFSS